MGHPLIHISVKTIIPADKANMNRFLASGLLGLFTLVGAQAQMLINGAGSTFDYPVF